LFLIRKPPAEEQFQAGLRLESLGVPVVRFLACGVGRSFRGVEESILITEAFDGVPLRTPGVTDWSAVLLFLQAMHDKGVIQPDLHAGNLLVRSDNGELRLVDVGHVEFKRRITPAERLANLAFLKLSVPIPLPREADLLVPALRKRVYRRRSRRCLKENREFASVCAGGLVWHARRPFLNESLCRIMEDPDGVFENGARLLKAGRTTTVGSRDGFVLKRFNLVKPANVVKDLFRGSRAKRTYRLAYQLELLGIRTPRPLAFAERKKAGFLLKSYGVCEEIRDSRTLAALLNVDRPIDPRVVRNLAELIARLHEEGFSYRDPKGSNFLVGGEGEIFLLDLDGLRFGKRISETAAAANLARLARAVGRAPAVGPKERLAFLLQYYRTRGLKGVPASHRNGAGLMDYLHLRHKTYRRGVKARRYQALLDRLSEVETTPATGQQGTVVTVVMTSRPDPQRPAQVIEDHGRYIRPWWNSVNRIGLRGVILHDGLPQSFIEKATTANVRFVRMQPGPWPLLHERHRMVYDFLGSVDDRFVFVTDVSDVAFRWDPFDLVCADAGRHRLFIGSQAPVIGESRFMRQEMAAQYGEVLYPERWTLNPGIIGGLRENVMEFLGRLIAHLAELDPHFTRTDMTPVNKVAYDLYQWEELMTGPPLHSRFGQWEFRTSAAIMHK